MDMSSVLNMVPQLLAVVQLEGVCGVEELKSKLGFMKQLLIDVQLKQDERVVEIMEEARTICYEIEDEIETYVAAITSKRGILTTCISDHFCRRKLDSKLSIFNEQIHDLNGRLKLCRPDEDLTSLLSEVKQKKSDLLIKSDFEESGALVGIQENQKIVESLLQFGESPIVAIYGMGGIGKTTLARKVFEGIRHQFDAFAWVTLPQDLQIKSLLQHILLQLNPEDDVLHSTDKQLAQLLYKSLLSRRCLIVVEDVWSMSAWLNLQDCFPTLNSATRILVTTPTEDLAKRIADKGVSFELKILSEDDSWQLFLNKLNLDFIADHTLEAIGKAVVKRCGGLPLAISLIAGVLRSKHTCTHWKSVLERFDSYPLLEQSSPDFCSIQEILTLSYNDLPYRLRGCFLYCSIFPEDSVIEAQKLINLWVAEGFVSSDNKESETTMSDIAEGYFNELVMRNLISVQEEDSMRAGRVKSCRIHDLLRDMCLSKAKEENKFEVLDLKCGNFRQNMDSYPSLATSRRLSVYLNSYEAGYDICIQQKVSSKVRSLLFLNAYPCLPGLLWPPSFPLRNLRLLRVLDFNAIRFQAAKVPQGLEKLANLKYLSFRNCYLKELPSSIAKLSNLLTLDLRVSGEFQMTLPNDLSKLKHLTHLYLPCSYQVQGDDKLRLDGHKLLETLDNFDSSHCDVKGLLNLYNLRYLVAFTEGSLEDLEVITKCMNVALDNLRVSSLDLRNFDCYSKKRNSAFEKVIASRTLHTLHMDGHLSRLPELITPSLIEIFFSACEFTEDPMARLENLPNLETLVLHDGAFIGKQMVCSAYGFPSLRRLKLSHLQKLERWTIQEGALPKLRTLTLERCKNLEGLPDGLIHLGSLQELNVLMMPETFMYGLRKERKELYKIQHVPGTNLTVPG